MRKLGVQKRLFGAAIAATALTTGGAALAGPEGASEKDKHESGVAPSSQPATATAGVSATVSVGAAEHAAAHESVEGGEAKEEEEGAFYAGLDFVVGSATTTTVSQALPTSQQVLGTPVVADNKLTSYSFIFDAEYEFTHDFGVGLRVPLETAAINDPGDQRGAGAFGNVELETEGKVKLADGLHLKLGLGVALPTAQGSAIPDGSIPTVGPGIDQDGYDRFAAQRAAAMVRGYEDNALFEPSHLGIIPKVTLMWHNERLHIDPWVKLENLIATESSEKFIDELVFGVNLGYRATHVFEPTVRVWANVPVSNADFTTVAVVEPQLKFRFGAVDALGGVVLPFAGPLTSPYAVGVRFGMGVHF